MPIPAAAGVLASFVLFSTNVWGGIGNIDIAIVLVFMTSLAMVSNFKYAVMPRICFATKKDIFRSVWFISHIIVVICYPDEVFFPTGILYLLSGPAVYISAPAVNYVFHKADSR